MKQHFPTNATIPKPNRFHDDPNTYTGVHRAGGPTVIDRGNLSLSEMVNRDVKSNKISSGYSPKSPEAKKMQAFPDEASDIPPTVDLLRSIQGYDKRRLSISRAPVIETNAANDIDPNAYLRSLFEEYASVATSGAAAGGVDGAKFLKFCKDAKLIAIGSKFRKEDVDIVFAKYKEAGQRFLSKVRFTHALQDIAKRKEMSLAEMMIFIAKVGPTAHTKTLTTAVVPNRFHDDQSLYTGVHKAGGPTVVDRHNRLLSELVDRGVKK